MQAKVYLLFDCSWKRSIGINPLSGTEISMAILYWVGLLFHSILRWQPSNFPSMDDIFNIIHEHSKVIPHLKERNRLLVHGHIYSSRQTSHGCVELWTLFLILCWCQTVSITLHHVGATRSLMHTSNASTPLTAMASFLSVLNVKFRNSYVRHFHYRHK